MVGDGDANPITVRENKKDVAATYLVHHRVHCGVPIAKPLFNPSLLSPSKHTDERERTRPHVSLSQERKRETERRAMYDAAGS
jgi:hypothetical protein